MTPALRVTWHVDPLFTQHADLRGLHDDLGIGLSDHVDRLRAWAQAEGASVSGLLAHRGEELVGALLLVVSAREVTLAGDGDLRRIAARDDEVARALAHAALALVRGARRLHVEQLAADDPTGLALRGWPSVHPSAGQPVPLRVFPPPAERTEHTWAPKKFRQQARQSARRLDETAGFAVEKLDSPETILAALPECRELRRRRETEQGRGDSLSAPAARRLQDSLVRDLPGRTQLWQLRVGGQLAAYVLMVRDRGHALLWDGRMEPDLAEASPGTVLFAAMLRDWHGDPEIAGVDFGRGDTHFKRRLRNDVISTVTVRAWSSPARRDLDLAVERAVALVRSRLRRASERNPSFAATVSRLRGWHSARAARR